MQEFTSPHTKEDYEIVKREVLYQGVFRLVRLHIRHRLFNGNWSPVFTRELLERTSAVSVLPYDPLLDRVILIEQFRPGALKTLENPWLIEIVAGVISSPNETPEAVAIREAQEEAGCNIQALYPIFDFLVSPGGTDEYLNAYIGKVDATHVQGTYGLAHEHEDIRVLNLSTDDAFAMVRHGRIKTVPAILSLQWLEYNRHLLSGVF